MKLYELSRLADLAYKQPNETEYTFCKRLTSEPLLRRMSIYCFAEDGLEGFIGFSPLSYHAVVVFRGTEEFVDLKTDLRTWPVANLHGVGYVHRGTQDYLSNAWDSVWRLLQDMGAVSVSFVGHSLGGMLAVLSSAWLSEFLPNVLITSVVTFGSPPVGSHSFAKSLDLKLPKKITHVVNCCDLIPRFWPTRLFGLRMTGSLLYLDRDGKSLVDPSWMTMVGDRLMAVWAAKSLTLSFSHHRRSEYTRKLELCGL